MDVDFNKMLDQDPEFKRFAEASALKMILADRANAGQLLGSIYSFYNMGMTVEQMGEWFKNLRTFTNPEDKPQ